MKRWVPIALVCCSCATVSESALIVRDGTVSAGADAAMIQGASDLAQGLQRVEQDQLVALAVLNKTSTCELRAQVAQARADWQEAFAVVGLAKAVQERLLKALKAPSPSREGVELSIAELNSLLTKVYAEIESGRKRIAERRSK